MTLFFRFRDLHQRGEKIGSRSPHYSDASLHLIIREENLFTRMKIFALTIALLASSVKAQELCDVAAQGVCVDDGCSGVYFLLVSGECSPLFSVCDDRDDTTKRTCSASKCAHLVNGDDPVCFTDCVLSCGGKECGEDDCGGFCGACDIGAGCSKFVCVAGMQDGGCEAPLNLGNTDTVQVIDTTDQTTLCKSRICAARMELQVMLLTTIMMTRTTLSPLTTTEHPLQASDRIFGEPSPRARTLSWWMDVSNGNFAFSRSRIICSLFSAPVPPTVCRRFCH
jgi:hypothetical protein